MTNFDLLSFASADELARAAASAWLDEIETALPKRVKDKSAMLLLHCASGMRSGIAKSKLHGMGYTNAFNLGSYGRAESVVNQSTSR